MRTQTIAFEATAIVLNWTAMFFSINTVQNFFFLARSQDY